MVEMLCECKKDRVLFRDMLSANLNLLFGKGNDEKKDTFLEYFFEHLEYFHINDWALREKDIGDVKVVSSKFFDNDKVGIKVCGYENYAGDEAYLQHVNSFALWQAILAVYGEYKGIKKGCKLCELKLYGHDSTVFSSCGFINYTTPDDVIPSGYYLSLLMADMLARLSLCDVSNSKDVSNILYGEEKEADKCTIYGDIQGINKLLIAAFSVDVNATKLYDSFVSGEGIEGVFYKNDYRGCLLANSYIEGLLNDPLMIMEEYDRIMGSGSYIYLVDKIDYLCECFDECSKPIASVFMQVLNNILKFGKMRIDRLYFNEYITKEEHDDLVSNLNQVYASCKKNIHVQKVKSARKKFKNRVKQLVKGDKK